MERVSSPHMPCDRLHKLQQHRSSWAGVSSSSTGQLSLRKPSFLVLAAAHMLGRSHRGHMKLAYPFPTIFRPLTWVPLNLSWSYTQSCSSDAVKDEWSSVWNTFALQRWKHLKEELFIARAFPNCNCMLQNFSAGKQSPQKHAWLSAQTKIMMTIANNLGEVGTNQCSLASSRWLHRTSRRPSWI